MWPKHHMTPTLELGVGRRCFREAMEDQRGWFGYVASQITLEGHHPDGMIELKSLESRFH